MSIIKKIKKKIKKRAKKLGYGGKITGGPGYTAPGSPGLHGIKTGGKRINLFGKKKAKKILGGSRNRPKP